ncbi:hypothetical protein MLD52_19330 [Puniceicoccaceae bacterium K14]|nr:hypothetical protein [Puniceicoccaceae bacterium K14]
MKKTIFAMTALALAGASSFAEWQVVDDFDGADNTDQWLYRFGDESGGNLNTTLEIQDDPAGDDKCLVFSVGTVQTNAFTLDLGAMDLALEVSGFDTSLRTVYYEWLIPNIVSESGTTIGFQNATSGMMSSNFYYGSEFEADGVTPRIQPDPPGLNSGPGWGNYAGYLRSNSGKFDTRDDGFVDPQPDIQEVGDEWFKFWVIYDIAGRKYQVWCQGGTFDEPTLVTTEHEIVSDTTTVTKFEGNWARFRADSSDPLDWFTVITNIDINETNGTKGNHNSYMDNLYVDLTGMNLTDPTGGDPVESNLINISTRGKVGIGDDVMIGGFVIEGDEAKKVLIQGIGSELGLDGVLADPYLTLVPPVGDAIVNDDWDSDATAAAEISAANDAAGASTIVEGSGSSAMVVTLDPGIYTVVLQGATGGTGIALVEVYDID